MSHRNLDVLDRRILWELGENARRSTSEIARRVKQGRDRIEDRLRRLIERGVITRFSSRLNPRAIGLQEYRLSLQLEQDTEQRRSVLSWLRQHGSTIEVTACRGPWDFIVRGMATSHFEVDSLSRNLATTFRTTIIDSQTAFVIDSRYANRGYLSPSTERSCIEQPTPLGVAKELLPVDRRIVELLLQQARLPITTLAEKVRESRPMIKYRLRRLEELGFLEGHTVELQLERIGMVKLVIQLETYSDDPALISELTSWCLKNPFVTRLTTQTGQYAIELEIEAPSLQSSSQIIDACCAEVPGLIRRANALLVDRTVSLWRAEGLEAPSGMMLSTAA